MRSQTTRLPFSGSLFSVVFILFFWGCFIFLAVSFHVVLDNLLTGMKMKVILSDYVSPQDAEELQKHIRTREYALSAKYISKEAALKAFDGTGEQFNETMDGVNPLPAVIEVQLNRDYILPETVEMIGKELLERRHVVEIYYPVRQVAAIMDNLTKIQLTALGAGILLTIIALLLIINTVKLAIHSKRMLIRSMQLVGAGKSFIRKPFLRYGMLQGSIAGLTAAGLILGLCVASTFGGFLDLSRILFSWQFQAMLGGLIVFGLLLGYLSSRIAVNRFLDKNLDALHD